MIGGVREGGQGGDGCKRDAVSLTAGRANRPKDKQIPVLPFLFIFAFSFPGVNGS
jgi:hypothetical protein